MSEEKVVMFGTGEDLNKCLGILREQGIEPYCFTDNDSSKWGTVLEGKKIIAPQELTQIDCQIVISTSDYKAQIMEQLKEAGLTNRILEYEPIFRRFIEKKANEYHVDKIIIHNEECILFDAFMGKGWAGDSQYACCIAACLKERGYDTHVYARDSLLRQEDKTEKLIQRFPWHRERYWDTMLPIIKDMEQRLPFVLIANTLEYVMAAAYILKQKYPDKVRIISVVHNDNYSLYEKQAQWQDSLEKILGISRKIRQSLEEKWQIPTEKLYYKVNPVLWEESETKEEADVESRQEICDGPIRIGWGGRLVTSQKRADLLPDLIKEIEKRKVDYCLEIAGDGDCYPMIETYLKQNGLEERVHLLGRLEHHMMRKFWSRQQVYINISEYEGSCLAMLEAMECGVVPVVTDVSGVEDVIDNGRTGFRVGIGKVKQIAEKITYLTEHPEKIKQMSQQAMEIVKVQCGLHQYIDYMEDLIKQ